MDAKEDMNLARLLDCYQVADADPGLLERIVARAEAAKAAERNAPARFGWMRLASVAVAAAFGFWLGGTLPPPVSNSTQARTAVTQVNTPAGINVDRIILGPQSLNEVIL